MTSAEAFNALDAEERRALFVDKRAIDAIKSVRNRTGLGLKEAKDLVDLARGYNWAGLGAPTEEGGPTTPVRAKLRTVPAADPDRLAKLPAWAQEHISSLVHALKDAAAALDADLGLTHTDKMKHGVMGLTVGHEGLMRHFGRWVSLQFQVGEHPEDRIEVCFDNEGIANTSEKPTQVTVRSISGKLAVYPSSGNVVKVTVGDRWRGPIA